MDCSWRGGTRLVLAVFLSASCASVRPEKPLYERLGGPRAIHVIVDNFVGRVNTEPRLRRIFEGCTPRLPREPVPPLILLGPCVVDAYLRARHETSHRSQARTDRLIH